MIWCLLAFASAHEVAVFSEDPLPNSRAVFGEAGELLEARTGVPLTGWQWVEASQLSQGRLGVARREPVEPPLAHHDYAPATPVFASDWHAPAPAGLGVAKLWAWPGGTGAASVVANVEYDFDPFHEDLRGNLPIPVTGEPYGQFAYHGNATFGIVAAARDTFGTSGAAPDSLMFAAHPIYDGRYSVARAIAEAALQMQAGDVLLVEQQWQIEGTFSPVSTNPMAADAMLAASELGIIVVEPMGNGGTDAITWDLPWVGSLRIGSIDPASGRRSTFSNFGVATDLCAWGAEIVAPSNEEYAPDLYFPNGDPLQAYTSAFGGTSGASAQLAGIVAQLQSISRVVHDQPLSAEMLREGLAETGVASNPESPCAQIPDARSFALHFLVP